MTEKVRPDIGSNADLKSFSASALKKRHAHGREFNQLGQGLFRGLPEIVSNEERHNLPPHSDTSRIGN
jgi:hypothetical protein